jgi:hypothetical protein
VKIMSRRRVERFQNQISLFLYRSQLNSTDKLTKPQRICWVRNPHALLDQFTAQTVIKIGR